MALTLYRRHSAACKKTEALKKVPPAQRKFYQHCQCGCYFTGTWAGMSYDRKALNCTNWKEAEKLLEAKQTATTLTNALAPGGISKISLREALDGWHLATELAGRAASTMGAHQTVSDLLLTATGNDPEFPLTSVGVGHIDKLRLAWTRGGASGTTQRTYLSYLGAFFNFCRRRPRRWIFESPMPDPKEWPPANAIDREETMPLDPEGGDANYRALIGALEEGRGSKVPGRDKSTAGRKPLPLRDQRANLIALCKLMYESGPRISDGIMFRFADVKVDAEIATWTYLPIKTKRTGKKCTTFIPLWLYEEIRQLPMLSPGYPFFDGTTIHQNYSAAYKAMVRAGNAVGVPDVRPHRFRDSFAVNLLNRDVPVATVSGYLGHKSVRTTEEYYSPWVKSRVENARRKYLEATRRPSPANVLPFPAKQA